MREREPSATANVAGSARFNRTLLARLQISTIRRAESDVDMERVLRRATPFNSLCDMK